MSFLPEDYQPPVSSGHYLKLQQGTNLLRILSKPILGWEMWNDQQPLRYPLDQKPEAIGDAKPREFWSMLAWNYNEEKLQIFHVTQGSIKKAIRDLAMDESWGSPVSYDIRITKSGHQLKTNYAVTPCPKTPVPAIAKEMFSKHPCLLEALYQNEDPFADWGKVTPPLWESAPEQPKTITDWQYGEIMALLGKDGDYRDKVIAGAKKTFKIESLKDLPLVDYPKVLAQVQMHFKPKQLEDDLPF